LPENSPDFPIPFFVYADDDDENGTQNAEVNCFLLFLMLLLFESLLLYRNTDTSFFIATVVVDGCFYGVSLLHQWFPKNS
jgi:hypothetical protein